ncbi:MAG: hypothetical protein LQ348_000187 [Seirophora lacunosa]|nr:MAG: hypothetical protein LQ348_000187 [Seirophora lacunosa]
MAQLQIKSAVKRKFNQSISNTATKTAIQFDVQQSLGLAQRQSFTFVHTLLHSSLAHLAYLRHLFPDDCFEDKSFDAICEDAETLYRKDDGRLYTRKRQRVRGNAADRSASSSDLKVLIPNSRPGVDVFLGWLDGILQAVRKGTLTKAQFCICPDPMDRTNIIESYTLRFYYGTEDRQSPQQLVGLADSGTGSQLVPITGLKKSVVDLLALVASLTAKMPDLPGTRFLTCHLFHLRDSACDFHRYGFETSNEKVMVMEDSSEWRPKTVEAGYVDSGQHRVSLDITHMQRVGEEDAQSDHLYTIPDKMLHNRVLSRLTGSPQANLVSSSPPQTLLQGCPDPPVPTQEVAASGQAETAGKSMQLSPFWAERLERRASKRSTRDGPPEGRLVDCQCHHSKSEGEMLRPSSGLIEYRISSGYTTNLDDRNFIEMSDQRLSAELQPPWGPTCVVCPQRTRTHAPLFLK